MIALNTGKDVRYLAALCMATEDRKCHGSLGTLAGSFSRWWTSLPVKRHGLSISIHKRNKAMSPPRDRDNSVFITAYNRPLYDSFASTKAYVNKPTSGILFNNK